MVKVASLGFLRFFQPDEYPENTWQMFFLLPNLSARLIFTPLPAVRHTRALKQKKSTQANSSPALSVRFGGCAMDRDTATSEMLQSHLVPGSTDSLGEAELAGKGSTRLLPLQLSASSDDSIFL